jgi:hypothetical protein
MVTTDLNKPMYKGIKFVATAIKNDSSECGIKNVQHKKQKNPNKQSMSISINISPLFLILLAPECTPAADDGVSTQNRRRYLSAIWMGPVFHLFQYPEVNIETLIS